MHVVDNFVKRVKLADLLLGVEVGNVFRGLELFAQVLLGEAYLLRREGWRADYVLGVVHSCEDLVLEGIVFYVGFCFGEPI